MRSSNGNKSNSEQNSAADRIWHQKAATAGARAGKLNFLISSLYGCYTPLSFFHCGERRAARWGRKRAAISQNAPTTWALALAHTHYYNGAAAGGILARLNVLMVTQSEPHNNTQIPWPAATTATAYAARWINSIMNTRRAASKLFTQRRSKVGANAVFGHLKV